MIEGKGYYFDKHGNVIQGSNSGIRVAYDKVGNYIISTVAIDPTYSGTFRGMPLLFETMVYLEDADYGKKKTVDTADCGGLFNRYLTRKAAFAGHKKMVQKVKYNENSSRKN